MTDDLSFGRWLKRQRRLLDLTQEELASRVGYAVTTLRRIESDELRPSKALAEKLADALDVPASERDTFLHFARGERGASLPLPPLQVVPVAEPAAIPPTPAPPMPPLTRHNLPIQISSFVGREREMDRLSSLLDSSRLVTLSGVGGTGKTRLALEVAAQFVDRYANGVWLVELAPLMDATLLPQMVARAFSLRDQPGRPLLDTLTDYLREKDLLLILDNCEHLIEAASQLADSLLHGCPGLHILATSREALGIIGEAIFQVPSLSLPGRAASLADVAATLDQYEAVRLFVERATAVEPTFAATPESLAPIVHICRTLDGIPLALELAAARVRTMPLAQLAARIEDRFRLLTGGSRTALSRQRTLQGVVDWSYGLLTEAERTLLQRLSVFAGGWTLEAAEAVCSGGGIVAGDILDLLTHLVEKSLVVVESQGGVGRYRLLETIRQYSREKLVEAGAAETLQDRHLAYYLALAEEGDIKLRGHQQIVWLQRLETEHDNLRAALAWSQASPTGGEAGLRLAGALGLFWYISGKHNEGYRWLKDTLAHPAAQARTAPRAKALWGAAQQAVFHDDQASGHALLEESIAIAREVGDTWQLAWSLRTLGWKIQASDFSTARALWAESLVHFQSIGDKWGLAWSLIAQGNAVLRGSGDYAAARPLFETSVALFRELGDRISLVLPLSHLGMVDLYQGDLVSARSRFEERLWLAREMGDKFSISVALDMLGLAALWQGDYSRADELFAESQVFIREIGGQRVVAFALIRQAEVARARGDYPRAATLYRESLASAPNQGGELWFVDRPLRGLAGVAVALRQVTRAARLFGATEALNTVGLFAMWAPYTVDYERDLASIRAQLGEAEVAAAWAAGQAMTLEQAVAYALEDASPHTDSEYVSV